MVARVLGWARRFGPDGRGFEALLLAGPVLLVVLALLGRSVLTEVLVAGYLLTFVTYVLYRGLH